jgi:mycothiol synthase
MGGTLVTKALIRRFDPDTVARSVLLDYHDLMLSTGQVDRPGEQPQSFEAALERLRVTLPGRGPAARWAAYEQDRLVGLAEVNFPDQENAHIALTEVRVHPGHRRRGTGTALLRAALPEIDDRGRSVVVGWGVTVGGAGSAWATRLGFRPVHADVLQVLDLHTVDRERWRLPEPERYRLVEWIGSAPAGLLESAARAWNAIQDQPPDDASYSVPGWTAERIRAHEQQLRDDGIEQRVVVAVDRSDGEVVGLTELLVLADRPSEGLQGETAVVAGHRGRGLGRQVKAAMLRRLVVDRPDMRRILTSTAADNTFMIAVNLGVGFRTVRRMIDVEAEVVRLLA